MEQEGTSSMSPTVTASALATRLINVFTSPTEVYSEVAVLPVQKSSWVVPWILAVIMGLVVTIALFTNENLRQQIYDMQIEKMRENVEAGTMTETQLERIREGMEESGPLMFVGIGGVSAAIMISVTIFGAAFVLWLVMKFGIKSAVSYEKTLEMYGLATIIGILGTIVTVLLMYAFDSMYASPGLGIAVIDAFDPKNNVHSILAAINLFSIWQTAVVGVGVARISGKPTVVGLTVAFVLWIIYVIATTLLGVTFR